MCTLKNSKLGKAEILLEYRYGTGTVPAMHSPFDSCMIILLISCPVLNLVLEYRLDFKPGAR